MDSNYNELELFWLNHTNFTETQANKFVDLIEKINHHSKEVKFKQHNNN